MPEWIKKRNISIKRKINTTSYILILMLAIFGVACSSENSSENIYGTYMIYSEDPQVSRFIEGQDTYIQLNEDQTIVYNSTINDKPKFNFRGKFTIDENSNTLKINWQEGKLPDTLKVEKEKESFVIRIGNSIYKKGKPRN